MSLWPSADPAVLHTARLDLVPLTLEFVQAVLAGDGDEAERLLGAALGGWPAGDELAKAFPHYLEVLRADPAAAPWQGRAAVLRAEARVVGSGNLKGRPSGSGDVEIGYEVNEADRRAGYATEIAAALVAFAMRDASVSRVVAAIDPANVASRRVAEAAGLRPTGERTAKYGGPERLWAVTRLEYEASHGSS